LAKSFYVNSDGKNLISVPEPSTNNYVSRAEFSDTGLSLTSGFGFAADNCADAASFREGLAAIRSNGKYGYINSTGQFVSPPTFENAGSFTNGIAIVRLHGKLGYIDRTGKFIIAPQFEQVCPFSEGLAAAAIAKDKWGYIDLSGKFVIPPKYYEAFPFSNGVAHVTVTTTNCTCH
jgi:hypothetical protein